MARRDTLEQIARRSAGWRTLVDRIHQEAGLEEYDDDLIELVIGEVEYAAREEVWALRESSERRRELIETYRQTKSAAAATAARA